MSDTIRVQGFQADINAIYHIAPTAYSSSSAEVLGTAIDTTTYGRSRILVIASHPADATSTGVTITIKESATSGGSYAAGTFTGTAGASTAARTAALAYKRNPAKPFMKVSMTPAGGSGVLSAQVIFIGDGV